MTRKTDCVGALDQEVARLSRSGLIRVAFWTGPDPKQKNITSKRPGIGINPMYFWKILGKKATKNYHINDPIKESFNKKE